MWKTTAVIILSILCMTSLTGQVPSEERSALIALYQSAGGTNWFRNENWLGPEGTECEWAGILCDAAGSHVVEIKLSQNNLTGELPSEIGWFSQLEILSINSNHQLSGNLPPEIGNLLNLRELLLTANDLSGTLPSEIGDLAQLTKINLTRNEFDGALPAEIGNLADLKELVLASNNIGGFILPEIGNLVNLENLDLNFNDFTGPIPSEIGNLVNLQWLGLGLNQLNGSIPTEIGNLANLVVLGFFGNQLTGPIPTEIGNLTQMWFFNLSNNKLSGPIPTEIGNLREMEMLALDTNQLSGPIPTEIGNLSSLILLRLWVNQLSGPIPSEMGNMKKLQHLWAHLNLLSGCLPSELGNLKNLDFLMLFDNCLTGPIPTEFGNMRELGQLDLTRNQLSGPIPSEFGQLTGLVVLEMGENQLSGEIPSELSNLKKLKTLGLYDNQLSGGIPSELSQLTSLESWILGENQLSGPIPVELADMNNLLGLSLSHNELSGPIPPELGNLTLLNSFDLGNNHLEGAIPSELGNLTNLRYFGLADNRLSGPVPPELGNLTQAYAVHLAGNRLTGPVPDSLINLTELDPAYPDYGGLDLRWNALFTDNPELLTFLENHHATGSFGGTQTVATEDVAWAKGALAWTPIEYTADGGGYQVWESPFAAGPYALAGMTADKATAAMDLPDPPPGETRFYVVNTVTDPHDNNQSQVDGELSAEIRAGPDVARQKVIGAHLAVDDVWWTRIRLVNTGQEDHPVILGAVNARGELDETVTVESLPSWNVLDLDPAEIFSAKTLEEDIWLTAACVSPLAGVVEFGTRDDETLVSIPLEAEGRSELIFPYVIANEEYFTGLTLVNTESLCATARLEAFTEDGESVKTAYQVFPSHGKYVRLVDEIFDVDDPSVIRFVRVSSDRLLAGFEIFGTYERQGMAGMPCMSDPETAIKNGTGQAWSAVYPELPDNGEYYTGATVSNLSVGEAELTCVLYDTEGNPLDEALWTAAPGVQITREIWTMFQGQIHPDAAWMEITAASPIIGFELVLSRDPSEPYRFGGFSGTPDAWTHLVFPLVKNTDGWMARATLTNPSAGECAFTVTAFDEYGFVVDTVGDTLPGHGQYDMDIAAMFPGENVASLKVEASVAIVGHIVHLSDDLTRMSGYSAQALEHR